MVSRNNQWLAKHRAEVAEKHERAKTCTHEGKGTIGMPGCLGGTWRTRCAYCNTLLHDTLWDWVEDDG